MLEEKGSRTSVGVAVLRAVHQLTDTGPRLLDDPVIVELLDPSLPGYIRTHIHYYHTSGMMALRSHIVLRSRYTEDCLQQAAKRGTKQYVLLGAGLDTFAYRQPAWAGDLQIIEADHPASQSEKLERLKKANIPIPENVSFVSLDLESDNLQEVLGRNLNLREPVFISSLGVLVYLRPATVGTVFKFVAGLARSSEFVFTFSQKLREERAGSIAERAAAAGEPWLTYHTPEELREELTAYGINQVFFLEPDEAKKRYFNDLSFLPPPQRSSIAHLIIK